MDKKKYEQCDVRVICFNAKDVLTESGDVGDEDELPGVSIRSTLKSWNGYFE